jgi:hypothetical protein
MFKVYNKCRVRKRKKLSVDPTAGSIMFLIKVAPSPLNRRPARLYLLFGGSTCKHAALFNTRPCCCRSNFIPADTEHAPFHPSCELITPSLLSSKLTNLFSCDMQGVGDLIHEFTLSLTVSGAQPRQLFQSISYTQPAVSLLRIAQCYASH